MFPCRNKYLAFLLVSASGLQLHAQTTSSLSNPRNGRDNNPYSKFGIGELVNRNNAAVRGIANLTSTYSNTYSVNTDNPATYSFMDVQRAVFEVGGTGQTRTTHGTVNGAETNYRTGTATLSYMTLAVPVSRNSGFCIGFRPYSRTYYSLRDTLSKTTNPPSPLDSAETIYKGEGSLNYAFIGGSAKYKGLSVGFNFGYLFGSQFVSTQLNPYDVSNGTRSYISEYSNQTRTGGIYWKGGLLYEAKLDSFYTLRIGGTITMDQRVKQHYLEYNIAGYNFGDTVVRDTAYYLPETRSTMTLPLSYSAGIMLTHAGKWGVGVDYTATQWSNFKSELNKTMNSGIAASSYRLALGSEYTPDATDIKHVLSRSTYRLGAYYGTEYLRLNGNDISYYGITAGMSLPFKRYQTQVSYLHAAIEYGILGTTDAGLMRQNYLRFTLGASMTARWFDRKKYQ
ncbi:hypothetical protein [Nemorincola caseinilytica]